MSHAGPTIYQALRRELDVARSDVERQQADAARLEERLRQLASERGQALLELARFSLPEMSRPAIERTLDQARGELVALLAEKQRHEAGLRGRRDQSIAELRRLEVRLDEVTRALNQKVEERGSLEATVAAALKKDEGFQERSTLAAKAEADLHRDEGRVKELRAESSAKLPAFQASSLFQYLMRRKYGTPEYSHRGLSRRLDRWVARLIDFPRARLSYEFLERTPDLVEAEVVRRRALFEELMKQVEAIQKAKSDELGLTSVLEEGHRLGADREREVQALEALRSSVAELERQLSDLGTASDPYHQEALQRLQRVLATTETRVLELRAKQTPEPEDDELVARVRATEHALAGVGSERAGMVERARQVEQYQAGLVEIVHRFRAENYDSTRSRFDGRLDLASTLEGLRRGTSSPSAAWRTLSEAHAFEPHWVDQGGGMINDAISSPQGRILIEAIGGALEGAMREAGRRGVERRAPEWGGGGFRVQPPSPASMPTPRPVAPASGGTRPGGFTTGDGF